MTFEGGIEMAIRLGGDTDTRAAITGAILGAKFGFDGVPLMLKNHVYQGTELSYLDRELFNSRVSREGQDTKTSL